MCLTSAMPRNVGQVSADVDMYPPSSVSDRQDLAIATGQGQPRLTAFGHLVGFPQPSQCSNETIGLGPVYLGVKTA